MSKTMTLAVLAAISNAQFFTADGDAIEEIDWTYFYGQHFYKKVLFLAPNEDNK